MIVIMKSRILLFLGLLSCIGLQMFAQVSVSGKVVDAGGIEMPGVNIAIKGTMVGTMTGADGTFTLSSIPGGKDAVLVFSFIGFRSQEVKVGNRTFINVKLEEDTEQLEEVVVVAYGTQRKKDLTGAITQIDSKIICINSSSSGFESDAASRFSIVSLPPGDSAGAENETEEFSGWCFFRLAALIAVIICRLMHTPANVRKEASRSSR